MRRFWARVIRSLEDGILGVFMRDGVVVVKVLVLGVRGGKW